ncbi:MAG: hypothetical protein VYD32_05300 [Pseudomonadota bacterium]|nr:hypothetical protein [Pseudomonadota bacterium]MEC7096201.1 hypothetical protein [Pseudomonadota bacterium]MEC7149045.1 hypothetical protein [Pseudomonadota bacterium]MEC7517616.1 hypothetical protein [Pseudomonadota bacterium]MEC7960167.1 hypothetical protein [Pseudomonadota bacterium]
MKMPLKALCIALLGLAACEADNSGQHPNLTDIRDDWLVTPEEAIEWASVKHNNLPTLTGSSEWLNYMSFLETTLDTYGVVDGTRNAWLFERWHTSEDSTQWSLSSDGASVRVAHYGAYSGSTGPEGITAELIYYDHENPPESIEGKIVVIPTRKHPNPPYSDNYLINYTFNDYEYATDAETLPAPFEFVPPTESFTFDIWWQLAQGLDRIPRDGNAAGAIIVYDMAYERTKGLYTFGVPTLYNSPTLILSREDGAKVIDDAKQGKSATLRLEAVVETSEAFQYIAYLPGANYGTPEDEQIILVNHTDGPSITQDNGALGLLGIVKYFSNIPQSERPRTLTVFLDCRHYMPGMEDAHAAPDWFTRFPEKKSNIVGMIQTEHLGEMDYREVDGRVEPTDHAEQSYLWTRNNEQLITAAKTAVSKYGWSRAQLSVPERPGKRGSLQQVWWGVGAIGQADTGYYNCDVWHCLDLPGFGLGGFLGYYWTSDSGIDRWNEQLFVSQTSTMTELTGVLMTADLSQIQSRGTEDSFLDKTNRDQQFGGN